MKPQALHLLAGLLVAACLTLAPQAAQAAAVHADLTLHDLNITPELSMEGEATVSYYGTYGPHEVYNSDPDHVLYDGSYLVMEATEAIDLSSFVATRAEIVNALPGQYHFAEAYSEGHWTIHIEGTDPVDMTLSGAWDGLLSINAAGLLDDAQAGAWFFVELWGIDDTGGQATLYKYVNRQISWNAYPGGLAKSVTLHGAFSDMATLDPGDYYLDLSAASWAEGTAPVPLPGAVWLLASGLGLLCARRRRN
jgi:hypothetical protein